MAVMDQLTLASATPKRDTSPTGRFRRRLIEALDLQIEMAEADRAGSELKRTRRRWIKTENGGKELRELPVRLKRWWWRDEGGRVFVSLRRGSQLIEIASGKKAIEVGGIEDLPGKLAILRQAVLAGELDGCAVPAVGPTSGKKKGKPEASSPKGGAPKA